MISVLSTGLSFISASFFSFYVLYCFRVSTRYTQISMEWTNRNFLQTYKGRPSDPNVSSEGDRSLNCLPCRKDNILQFSGISSLLHGATTDATHDVSVCNHSLH